MPEPNASDNAAEAPTVAAYVAPGQPTRRHWLNAYILEDWRRNVGPLLRASYKANDDAQTVAALRKARDELQGWIVSIESVLADV